MGISRSINLGKTSPFRKTERGKVEVEPIFLIENSCKVRNYSQVSLPEEDRRPALLVNLVPPSLRFTVLGILLSLLYQLV
jgi:hypothetical protein